MKKISEKGRWNAREIQVAIKIEVTRSAIFVEITAQIGFVTVINLPPAMFGKPIVVN